jgi:Tetratricopeptide repeat/TIR domain
VAWLLASPGSARGVFLVFAVVPILAVLFALGTLEVVIVALSVGALGFSVLFMYGRLLRSGRSHGYEILEQDHEWDLARPDGSLAIHRKRLRVRYLNQVISIADFAWGDGNLFAEYTCDPGRVVDRIVVKNQLWVLISLGDVRKRGSQEVLEFRRSVTDGFLNSTEWVELEALEAKHVSLKVVFPKERRPKNVEIVKTGRSPFGRRIERREVLPASAMDEVSQRQVITIEERTHSPNTKLQIRWEWPPIGVFISYADAEAQLADRLASYLQSCGLTVGTSAGSQTVGSSRGVAANLLSEATVTVLIVGQDTTTDQVRSEWSVALENKWGPDPRPVAVLLVEDAEMPAPLRVIPGFRLPADPECWTDTFERLRRGMWSLADLIVEGDVKPDSERDRQPTQGVLESPAYVARAEPEPAAFAMELRERRELLEQELAHAEQIGDETAVRQSSYALGLTLSNLGESNRALELLERAIGLTEKQFGSTHPDVADGSYNLALLYESLGDLDTATELLRRAVAVGEAALGPDHPKIRVYRSALETIGSSSAPGYA